MFNGNLIARLIKEQRKQVGDMVAYVFGGNSHISKTYFKNRTSIDSKYLEKLSAFFQVPIQDFFLTASFVYFCIDIILIISDIVSNHLRIYATA